MKIQAFPIVAVLAALLSIVCDTPAANEPNERADEPEDRSCTKRDRDAQNARKEGKTVESCNYFCKPHKDSDNYEEKMYPEGTKCKYGDKVSRCTKEGCPYPTDSADENKGEDQPSEESNNGDENEENEGEDEWEMEGDGGEEEEKDDEGEEEEEEEEEDVEKEEDV